MKATPYLGDDFNRNLAIITRRKMKGYEKFEQEFTKKLIQLPPGESAYKILKVLMLAKDTPPNRALRDKWLLATHHRPEYKKALRKIFEEFIDGEGEMVNTIIRQGRIGRMNTPPEVMLTEFWNRPEIAKTSLEMDVTIRVPPPLVEVKKTAVNPLER